MNKEDDIHGGGYIVTREEAERCHAAAREIVPHLVRIIKAMRELRAYGIDAVVTVGGRDV